MFSTHSKSLLTAWLLAGVSGLAFGAPAFAGDTASDLARDEALSTSPPLDVLSVDRPRTQPRDSTLPLLARRWRAAMIEPRVIAALPDRTGGRIRLQLFDDAAVVASRAALQLNDKGFTWFGSVEGAFGDVVLTLVDGRIRGTVQLEEHRYSLAGDTRRGIEITEVEPASYGSDKGRSGHVVSSFDDVRTRDLPSESRGDAQVWIPKDITNPALLNRTLNDYAVGRIPLWRGHVPPEQKGYSLMVDDGTVIDVLPVYTYAALAYAGFDVSTLQGIIQHAFDLTNTALNESGVSTWLNMLPLQPALAHVEHPDIEAEITRLIDPADGYLDEVHQWRREQAADVIVMFGGPDAYQFVHGAAVSRKQPVDNSVFAEKAFAAFNIDSVALGSNHFAHELGHLLGVAHDWYFADGTGSAGFDPAEWLPQAHGYTTPLITGRDLRKRRYYTIMAYANECIDDPNTAVPKKEGCIWIPRFSNPDLYYGAATIAEFLGNSQPDTFFPIGRAEPDPEPANAVQAINAQVVEIARHRLSACRLFYTAPICKKP